MKNKITLSGLAGSGKTTVGELIKSNLGYNFVSIGNYSRQFAKNNYNMTINEFQEKCKQEPELDFQLDKNFKKLCNGQKGVVIDYRLGFKFIDRAFHVLLRVSDDIAIERIKQANRSDELSTSDSISNRNSTMRKRFLDKYDVDFMDENNYDLVLNTDYMNSSQVASKIIKAYNKYNEKNSKFLTDDVKSNQPIPSVNYHLWEPCNMRCKFCFATFQDVKQTILPKGHLPEADALKVVENIAAAGFEKITFAGGEPLLCKWLPNLIKKAKQLGMTTMIVTNGSKLSEQFLKENKPYLDWIAVSIDSLKDESNIAIGRAISGKKPLNKAFYYNLIDSVHRHGYGLKINTVVNKVNYKENFVEFLQFAKPKRWKVLQVLPIVGQNDGNIDDFKITDKEYNYFLETHNEVKTIVPESNDEIKGSYVMVDPAGRFFDNSEGTHNYSKPILEVGVKKALTTMNYDVSKFLERGGIYDWENDVTQNSRKEGFKYE